MKLREIILFGVLFCSTAYASYIVPNGSITNAKLAAGFSVGQSLLAPRPSSSASPAPAGDVVVSGSSGFFTTNSTSFVNVTNLTTTLTTTGRPVVITLISDGVSIANGCTLNVAATGATTNIYASINILRSGTAISFTQIQLGGASSGNLDAQVPCGSINTMDFPPAGSYTYTIQAKIAGSSSLLLSYAVLLAYEL